MVPHLRNSPSIYSYQDNSIGVHFNGLLAELPAILDSFFIGITSDYIGMVDQGLWRATKLWGKHTYATYLHLYYGCTSVLNGPKSNQISR